MSEPERTGEGAGPAKAPRVPPRVARLSASVWARIGTPWRLSLLIAVASGVGLYLRFGRATGILGGGFAFFIAWVVSNLLLELPDPDDYEHG